MYRRWSSFRPHSYNYRRPQHGRRPTAKAGPSEITITDRVEEVRLLCREISSAVSNVEKWMNALYNLSRAVQDKKAFSELLSALSSLETDDKLEELNDVPTDDDKS